MTRNCCVCTKGLSVKRDNGRFKDFKFHKFTHEETGLSVILQVTSKHHRLGNKLPHSKDDIKNKGLKDLRQFICESCLQRIVKESFASALIDKL